MSALKFVFFEYSYQCGFKKSGIYGSIVAALETNLNTAECLFRCVFHYLQLDYGPTGIAQDAKNEKRCGCQYSKLFSSFCSMN